MYEASKKLQAFRGQLKQMDKQYSCGTDGEEQNEPAESTDGSQFEWTDEIHVSQRSNYSNLQTINRQDIVDSHCMNSGEAMESVSECASVELDEIPLSENFTCTISDMTSLDDVDDLMGNLVNPMQVETSYDEEFQTVDSSVILFDDEPENTVGHSYITGLTQENNGILQENGGMMCLTAEENNWRKDRKKKDNHNIIERRRRYLINDRIKELANLLPTSVPADLKQNKGSILKTSVEYMKGLIGGYHKIQRLEKNLKMMNAKYQQLFTKVFQLELKFKLYGWTQDLENSSGKKKKRSKKCLSEVNDMVETLINESMPGPSQQRRNRPSLPRKKNNATLSNYQNSNPDAKTGLKQHLYNKMSIRGRAQIDSSSSKGVNEQSRHEIRYQSPPLLGNTSDDHLGKSNLHKANSQQHVMDKDDNVQLGSKEGEQIIELLPEQCNTLLDVLESHGNEQVLDTGSLPQPDVYAQQECFSPVTSTGNMLERLLRRSEKSSAECSDSSSGLEESTESTTGMR